MAKTDWRNWVRSKAHYINSELASGSCDTKAEAVDKLYTARMMVTAALEELGEKFGKENSDAERHVTR